MVDGLEGEIVFEPEYRNADAVRGLEQFRYLWIVWGFSACTHKAASPVVRPPVLGGNERMGVFATRSPYRPNPIGLSSVRIIAVEAGPIIRVASADLMDGTPIYDIKPYIEYADSHPGAGNGFTHVESKKLKVVGAYPCGSPLSNYQLSTIESLISLDPRPRYHNDPERIYGMRYGDMDVRFKVEGDTATIVEIRKCET